MLSKWESLPEWMQTQEVREYYDILKKRKKSLIIKRITDFLLAVLLLILLSPVMVFIAVIITIDTPGKVFYRQTRVTTGGREFRIHKFRTMVVDADQMGAAITVGNDSRVTKVGAFLRKYRLDEIPQLLDVASGKMSFVGTRPEVPKYVQRYTNEMKATLLLPAGITSEASIHYKDEAELLASAVDVDQTYVETILPQKMVYNLKSIKEFSIRSEIITMIKTVFAVFGNR